MLIPFLGMLKLGRSGATNLATRPAHQARSINRGHTAPIGQPAQLGAAGRHQVRPISQAGWSGAPGRSGLPVRAAATMCWTSSRSASPERRKTRRTCTSTATSLPSSCRNGGKPGHPRLSVKKVVGVLFVRDYSYPLLLFQKPLVSPPGKFIGWSLLCRTRHTNLHTAHVETDANTGGAPVMSKKTGSVCRSDLKVKLRVR